MHFFTTPMIALSFLQNVLIALFRLPWALVRFGRCGLNRVLAGFWSNFNVDRWRLGLLPLKRYSGGVLLQRLPSGALLQVRIHLVGGHVNVAFAEVHVDQQAVGLFHFQPKRSPASYEDCQLQRTQSIPGDSMMPDCMAAIPDPKDASRAGFVLGLVKARLS